MLVARRSYSSPYAPLGRSLEQSDVQTPATRTLLVAGGSFILGVLWGWFASQA